jgi:hypothetical protein
MMPYPRVAVRILGNVFDEGLIKDGTVCHLAAQYGKKCRLRESTGREAKNSGASAFQVCQISKREVPLVSTLRFVLSMVSLVAPCADK